MEASELCLRVSFLQLSCTHSAGSWRRKEAVVLLQPLLPYGDVAGGVIPSHLSPRKQMLQSQISTRAKVLDAPY